MNTKKYFIAGVLMLAMSAPATAQEVNYAEALKPITAAIQAAPNDPKAAKDLIKEYQKTFKKNEEAIVALGNVYLLQHNYAVATDIANSVVNNKKFNGSLGYVLLGDIAALQDSIGNAGAAAQQYQTAISLDPQNVTAYERYAKVYRHVNSKVAVAKLEELRKVKPDYPVEATAAEIMLNDGKYQEALAWYGKANPAYMTEDNFYNYHQGLSEGPGRCQAGSAEVPEQRVPQPYRHDGVRRTEGLCLCRQLRQGGVRRYRKESGQRL